ncbi:MAG: AcrR family transcriptional regulator [Glaciecola sp.]|jgi:AcrR family transcriptional regulator
MTQTQTKQRAKSQATRLAILRAATERFASQGFHGTGIREIADEAGVAVSAMYYYAKSKDELLELLIRNALDASTAVATQVLEQASGHSERLVALVSVHVALHARNPRTVMVTDREFRSLEGGREPILKLRDGYEGLWADVLDAGAKAGEFADRGKAGRLAVLSMCTGVAEWYRPGGRLTIDDLARDFSTMTLGLVAAKRDGQPVNATAIRTPELGQMRELLTIDSEPLP